MTGSADGGDAAIVGRTVVRAGVLVVVGVVALLPSAARSADVQEGGTFRVIARSLDVGPIDPALEYTLASWLIVDTTCLRLDEAAAAPVVTNGGKTYTFRLRSGFRFADGKPVQADAFARGIHRILTPGLRSPVAEYLLDVVGAKGVVEGRAPAAAGVVARGETLVLRLARPVPDFEFRMDLVCAVPPTLPVDPEGYGAYPAAGPYSVTEYRPTERVVLSRNRFYGGTRPHHVDEYVVDLRASSWDEVLDRVEQGDADWGFAHASAYLDPARRLVAKYGRNRSRFFIAPGYGFRGLVLNTSRPLFRDNPLLRRAVSYAIDRSALRRAGGGTLESTLTDQYLPPTMRGFRDARIYPLARPDVARARALARGHTRSGKAVFYTVETAPYPAFAQSVRRDLARIGLDVEVKVLPVQAYFGRLGARGPYDIGFGPWIADYDDPYTVLNKLLEGRYVGTTNWARFDSPLYNRLLRRAASLRGAARYRAYGDLDVRLARDAAPIVAIDYANEPTLVSARVGCVRPRFDLTSVCLR